MTRPLTVFLLLAALSPLWLCAEGEQAIQPPLPAEAGISSPALVACLNSDTTGLVRIAMEGLRTATGEELARKLLWLRLASVSMRKSELGELVKSVVALDPEFTSPYDRMLMEDFMILQAYRLGDNVQMEKEISLAGLCREWSVLSPLTVAGNDGNGRVVPIACPKGIGPVIAASPAGTFAPASVVSQAGEKQFAIAGLDFELPAPCSAVVLAISCSTESTVFLDAPLQATLKAGASLPSPAARLTGASPALATTAFLKSGPLASGRHSLAFLLPCVSGSSISVRILDEKGAVLTITQRELSDEGSKFGAGKLTAEQDMFPAMNPCLRIAFPQDGDIFTLNAEKSLELLSKPTEDAFLALRLAPFHPQSASFLGSIWQTWSALVLSPQVAIASAPYYCDQSYLDRCASLFRASDVFLMTEAYAKMVDQPAFLAKTAATDGWTLGRLLEYSRLVSEGADPTPVLHVFREFPFDEKMIARLCAPGSRLSGTMKIDLLEQLSAKSLSPMVYYQDEVSIYSGSGKYAEAVIVALHLCKLFPWVLENWITLGENLIRAGDVDGAKIALQNASVISPGDHRIASAMEDLAKRGEAAFLGAGYDWDSLSAIAVSAGDIAHPKGLIFLARRFRMEASPDGTLRGTLVSALSAPEGSRAFLFSNDIPEYSLERPSVEIPDAFIVSRGSVPRRLPSTSEGLQCPSIGANDFLVVEQRFSLPVTPCFAPEAFDSISAAIPGVPCVSFEYSLAKGERTTYSWVSPGLSVSNVGGNLVFRNSVTFPALEAGSSALPRLAWTTMDFQRYSECISAEVASKAQFSVEMEKLLPNPQSDSRARFIEAFNSVRAVIKDMPLASARLMYRPTFPVQTISAGRGSDLEFAILFWTILKSSGIADEMRLYSYLPHDPQSFQPVSLDAIACPSFLLGFAFVFSDEKGVLVARSDCLLPLSSAMSSHSWRCAFAAPISPEGRFPVSVSGFEPRELAKYQVRLAASDEGKISLSASVVLSGSAAEALAHYASARPVDTAIRSFFKEWFENAEIGPEAVQVSVWAGSRIEFTVQPMVVDWSKGQTGKRLRVFPYRIDLKRTVDKAGVVLPEWVGNVEVDFRISGNIAPVPDNMPIGESRAGPLVLTSTGSREAGGSTFSISIMVMEEPIPDVTSYAALCDKIEELAGMEIQWMVR